MSDPAPAPAAPAATKGKGGGIASVVIGLIVLMFFIFSGTGDGTLNFVDRAMFMVQRYQKEIVLISAVALFFAYRNKK